MRFYVAILMLVVVIFASSCATKGHRHENPLRTPCKLELRDACIEDAVDLLRWGFHCWAAEKAGGCEEAHAFEPDIMFAEALAPGIASNSLGRISLSVTNTPAIDFIAMACQQAGCGFRVSGRRVLVAAKLYPASVIVTATGRSAAKRLSDIVIPSVEFRGAEFHDIMDFIRKCTAEIGEDHEVQDVRFRFLGVHGTRITLRGSRMTILELLDILTEIAPVSCVIDGTGVTLQDR